MSSNKKAKEELIRLYGAECFIEKLHLRKDDKPRRYTGKAQRKRMKQLTYHHIREKSKGGKATVENGALLSEENHQWFNKQSPEVQAAMNRRFQEYKKCKVVFTDDLDIGIKVEATIFEVPNKSPKKKFNRAKEKREFQKQIDEELEL